MDLGLWWTFPFFNTYGAKFISADLDSCLLNSPEGISALQLKVDLYQKHKIEGGAWITGGKGAREGFTNNIYAMIFTGPWDIEQLKKENKHFGVCLIPKGPKGTSTNVGGTDMIVFKTSKHPKSAFEFLKYLTSADVQVKWSNSLGQIPVNIDAYSRIDSLKYPELKVYMEQMKTAVPRPQIASYEDIETIINPELESALTGQKTVKSALDSAVRKINARLKEDKDPLY
jgi:multiple sugar transport system substrate-binding protein